MKILFIASWYPTKENPANGVFVQEHAKAVSLYNEVVVLHSRIALTPVKGIYEISDDVEDSIRTLGIKYNKLFFPKIFIYIWSVYRAFQKLIKEGWKPDIIHAHVFSAGLPAIIIRKKYKIPVVITEHWTGFIRHILNKKSILLARFAMDRANIILPVSEHLEEAIKSYGIKNQFKVIPNVVNTEMFPLGFNQKEKNKKTILFVGLLKSQKGVSYLLKALAQLKEKRQDFILDIVGDGQNRKEYEELQEELGLGGMVKFHGLKTKEQVAEFMKICDFLVQPSLYETFGVTYIEAMACGKPIIATQLPVLYEKINENRGILVPTKDTYSLAKAIDYMLDHYKDYSPEKISQYAKDNFSYEIVGKKLNDIYRNVLEVNL